MIGSLIMNEVRAVLRDGRLATLGASLLLVFVGLVALSSQATRAARAERDLVGVTAREQWDRQGVKHPHRGAHFGLYAFRPVSTLAALDPGVSAQLGQALWLEPHKRNMARFTPAADAPASARLGEVVPAFVLVTLLPLLIVGAGHRAVTQEREWGTLRMMYGAGFSGRVLLASKWAGLLLAFAALFLPAVALGTWMLTAAAPGASPADQTVRGALLLLCLLLYYAVIAALSIVVSAWSSSSRSAWLVLVAAWVLCVFVLPRVGGAVAERVVPLPTGEAFWAAVNGDIQRGLPGDGDAAARVRAFEAALLREHGATRLEELPFGVTARRRLFRDAYASRVHALHFDRLWDRYAAQQRVLRLTAALSPAVPIRSLSMALAGTDLHHARHFEEAAESYRDDFNRAIDEWDARVSRGVGSYERKYAGDALWSSIRPFAYRPPSVSRAVGAVATDLVVLLAWGLASGALLWHAGRRLAP